MKFYIEHGRLVLESCSDNMTRIGEHTKWMISFKLNFVMSAILYVYDGTTGNYVEKNKKFQKELLVSEKLALKSLIKIGQIIHKEYEKTLMESNESDNQRSDYYL